MYQFGMLVVVVVVSKGSLRLTINIVHHTRAHVNVKLLTNFTKLSINLVL